MVYQVYKNSKTNELVDKEEASKYVCYKLGIQIEPKGKNNEYTLEQQEFLKEFTEWYFSDGDWIEEEIEEDEEEDYYAVKDDMIYEDYINRRMEDM